jgi:hypothetical protein
MSADLLRSRLTDDIVARVSEFAGIIVEQRQAPLDEIRYNQGLIAGLRLAKDLLDERYRNLHSIG